MPRIISFIFSLLAFTMDVGLEARKFVIMNNCSYTVWPAFSTVSSSSLPVNSLNTQETLVADLPNGKPGRLWGRTGCDNSTGKFACLTGDCGSGNMDCAGAEPTAATLVEFTLDSSNDFYDISVVEGYNVPLSVAPHSRSCGATGCVLDVAGACPEELKLHGACRGACDAFKTPEYCCKGSGSGGGSGCGPTNYSMIFKKACPLAYTYPTDDNSTTFSCGGSPPYTVIFCPYSPTIASKLSIPLSESPSSSYLSPSPTKTNMTGRRQRLSTSMLVAVTTSGAVSILLVLAIWIWIWICKKKRKFMKRQHMEMDKIKTTESLQFDVNTLRIATRNFSVGNKLGEGGFGEVYKGKLENGKDVAVKRLLQNSTQGVDEFRTEVVLVAKLQHKNLVKLLGFCVSSKEKILVYEFLRNSSLDRFLFDIKRNASLGWQRRFNIIVGIARGLLYLHEDSRLKVVHRDLKTSNILLDDAMNPKISDFGLAKLFGEDQTQDNTKRIVGTYGYMAPEYAITGHYSVKSDVYSFGVIVLEIVSGQKNRFFHRQPDEEALLHRAWRLWNEAKQLELVDTTLDGEFEVEQVIRCIQIGLLCIQEDAAERPRMRSILDALGRPSISLPEPKAPRFFGAAIDPEDHRKPPYTYTGSETITDLSAR